jgi:capsid assembly protease
MNLLPHIAARLFMKPLLIHPDKLAAIVSMLGERVGVESDTVPVLGEYFTRSWTLSPAANRLSPGLSSGGGGMFYKIGRTAVIPVIGSLINRGAFIGDDGSGATSYEGLAAQFSAAASDPFITSIVMDIDSPGGEAQGMIGLADMVRAARSDKRIIALVNDMAASAAYGLASQAHEIVISPTSLVGSVGVVMLHVEASKQLEKRGVKPTLIFAGAHKVDGNPFEPLTSEVKADLQGEVDSVYASFITTVAAGRGLPESVIRNTEARIYSGATAVDQGLADRVGTFADVIASLSVSRHGGFHMATQATADLITVAQHQAELNEARASARAEGLAEGLREGRAQATAEAAARVKAILSCEAAKDRLPQAVILALGKTAADDAVEILASLPAPLEGVQMVTPQPPSLAERGQAPVSGGAVKPGATGPTRAEVTDMWAKAHARNGGKVA